VEVALGKAPDAVDTIIEITLDSPAAGIKPIPTPVTPKAAAGKQ
jgi:hypothetical protein